MSLTATEGSNSTFRKAPQGTHIGRCYQLVELGTHYNEKFDKFSNKILLGFELPLALIEDGELEGKPYSVASRYTVSLHPKSLLRPMLESWRGKAFTQEELNGFDLKKVLGVPCMIGVVWSDDEKYANITSVMKLPAGTECPEQVNAPVTFEMPVDLHITANQPVPLTQDEKTALQLAFTTDFTELSEGLQKVIKESVEYKLAMEEPTNTQEVADQLGGTVEEDWESTPF